MAWVLHIWRKLTIGERWQPSSDRSRMVRYVGGSLEYRAMTPDEENEALWWGAIR